ncbi:F-box domain-containing protein [Mycena chlorophos]|uniref:F-box domain-containing protein n=1 Tax=Mycena chlorophos TaxID=658473 RepID=A0A8H6S7J3_MYCCL|nr:F-box domain-containing protein [Mycena chlorophos]
MAQTGFPLPPELISEIFSWLPSTPLNSAAPPAALPAALLLPQVCREWRAISQTTPSLWRCLAVHLLDVVSEFRNAGLRTTLKAWLEPRRTNELEIELVCAAWDIPSAFTMEMVLIGAAARMRSLTLKTTRFGLRSLDVLRIELPSLERFSAHARNTGDPLSLNFEYLKNSPQLKDVALDSNLFVDPEATFIPWSALTRLSLQLHPTAAAAILRLTPLLEEFTLAFPSERWSASEDAPLPILLRHLRKLDIHRCNGTQILNYLRCPTLRDLVVMVPYGAEHVDNLLGFLTRADGDCALKRFKLHYAPQNSTDDLRSVLGAPQMAALEELLFTCTFFPSLVAVLSSDSRDATGTGILPSLKSLEITTDAFTIPDLHPVIAILDQRRGMESFRLIFAAKLARTELSAEVKAGLTGLKEKGMEVLVGVLEMYRIGKIGKVLFS